MIITHLLLGFVIAYIGFTPPSMLNITASKITIENTKTAAYQFIMGVAVVVLIQVLLAVALATIIKTNPFILVNFKKIAAFVFTLLFLVFLYTAVIKTKKKRQQFVKNNFVFGVLLAIVNMFAIPFFAIVHSVFTNHGWVNTSIYCTIIFAIGAMLGVISILSSYVFIVQKITKLNAYTKYFNLLIAMLTGVVAIQTILTTYF